MIARLSGGTGDADLAADHPLARRGNARGQRIRERQKKAQEEAERVLHQRQQQKLAEQVRERQELVDHYTTMARDARVTEDDLDPVTAAEKRAALEALVAKNERFIAQAQAQLDDGGGGGAHVRGGGGGAGGNRPLQSDSALGRMLTGAQDAPGGAPRRGLPSSLLAASESDDEERAGRAPVGGGRRGPPETERERRLRERRERLEAKRRNFLQRTREELQAAGKPLPPALAGMDDDSRSPSPPPPRRQQQSGKSKRDLIWEQKRAAFLARAGGGAPPPPSSPPRRQPSPSPRGGYRDNPLVRSTDSDQPGGRGLRASFDRMPPREEQPGLPSPGYSSPPLSPPRTRFVDSHRDRPPSPAWRRDPTRPLSSRSFSDTSSPPRSSRGYFDEERRPAPASPPATGLQIGARSRNGAGDRRRKQQEYAQALAAQMSEQRPSTREREREYEHQHQHQHQRHPRDYDCQQPQRPPPNPYPGAGPPPARVSRREEEKRRLQGGGPAPFLPGAGPRQPPPRRRQYDAPPPPKTEAQKRRERAMAYRRQLDEQVRAKHERDQPPAARRAPSPPSPREYMYRDDPRDYSDEDRHVAFRSPIERGPSHAAPPQQQTRTPPSIIPGMDEDPQVRQRRERREKQLAFQKKLKEQMRLKEERKAREKAKMEAEDMRQEQKMRRERGLPELEVSPRGPPRGYLDSDEDRPEPPSPSREPVGALPTGGGDKLKKAQAAKKLSYKERLKQQMLEKQRQKEEQRRRDEEEDAKLEARLAREREQLAQRHEREREQSVADAVEIGGVGAPITRTDSMHSIRNRSKRKQQERQEEQASDHNDEEEDRKAKLADLFSGPLASSPAASASPPGSAAARRRRLAALLGDSDDESQGGLPGRLAQRPRSRDSPGGSSYRAYRQERYMPPGGPSPPRSAAPVVGSELVGIKSELLAAQQQLEARLAAQEAAIQHLSSVAGQAMEGQARAEEQVQHLRRDMQVQQHGARLAHLGHASRPPSSVASPDVLAEFLDGRAALPSRPPSSASPGRSPARQHRREARRQQRRQEMLAAVGAAPSEVDVQQSLPGQSLMVAMQQAEARGLNPMEASLAGESRWVSAHGGAVGSMGYRPPSSTGLQPIEESLDATGLLRTLDGVSEKVPVPVEEVQEVQEVEEEVEEEREVREERQQRQQRRRRWHEPRVEYETDQLIAKSIDLTGGDDPYLINVSTGEFEVAAADERHGRHGQHKQHRQQHHDLDALDALDFGLAAQHDDDDMVVFDHGAGAFEDDDDDVDDGDDVLGGVGEGEGELGVEWGSDGGGGRGGVAARSEDSFNVHAYLDSAQERLRRLEHVSGDARDLNTPADVPPRKVWASGRRRQSPSASSSGGGGRVAASGLSSPGSTVAASLGGDSRWL